MADPDPDVRVSLLGWLEEDGHDVVFLASISDLAAYLVASTTPGFLGPRPDVVVAMLGPDTDVPPDGCEILVAMQGSCPFVAMTEPGLEPDRWRILELGAYAVLEKPLDAAVLRGMIRRILQQR